MRRALILSTSVLMTIFLALGVAQAAEVSEVAGALANDGFYVERGASISEDQAGDLVAEMRNAGEGFSLVVLSQEPPAGATTFADNVQFALGRGIVLVITPDSMGYVGEGEFFNEGELERALEAAFNTDGSDFDLAAAFVAEATGVLVGSTAEPVPTTVAAPAQTPQTSSGGGNGFLWFIVIVGGVVALMWWMSRRARAKKEAVDENRLSQARLVIQEQLNDIANDVLAMEDEIRVADNARAGRFYEQATETYNDATEALPKTDTPQGLVDLSNKLDVAIWQLDSAEAILDDKPLPERPEPKRLPAPEPSPRSGSTAPEAQPPRTTVPGQSPYQRRTTRRSSPKSGGTLMDLLILAGGAMMNQRRRSNRRSNSGGLGGGLGDLLGRRRQQQPPSTPTTRPRSSGSRSNPVPGPGRPAPPSSSGSSKSSSSSQRGTAGRVRSGRKRRKR